MEKEPITCQYIKDGRLCEAIAKLPETRKEFCTHTPKNYCCYLCSNRENCDISCSYLETPRKPSSLDKSVPSRIDAEIKEYQEEMQKLSVLLADGKIGEKSYLAASGTLERRMNELEKLKENPNTLLNSEKTSSLSGEFEGIKEVERPTALWYVFPFFFGIIGGIIGYVGTKDEDKEMADSLLIFGIVWSIILIFAYWFLLASFLSHLR